ncbi:hypothetical protein DFH09DRAFT_1333628 [Mycena vulgaris]|nr:hypothetical protein DFH09DRAFT_1333628 [Mycena vulgaris]
MSAPPPPHINWGVPGVSIPTPITRPPIDANMITDWDTLTLTPRSAFELSVLCPMSLDAGASEDGRHFTHPNVFFPEFGALYNSTPTAWSGQDARKEWTARAHHLMFDLATKIDLSTGSPTLILQCLGTTIPGVPLLPVAFIVQMFIENVGMVTADEWRTKVLQRWPLNQSGHIPTIELPTVLIPARTNERSAYYIFPGRPFGQLTLLGSTASPLTSTLPSTSAMHTNDADVYDIDDLVLDDEAQTMVDHLEEAIIAEMENRHLHARIEVLEAHKEALNTDLDDAALKIQRLENDLHAARVNTSPWRQGPSTPSCHLVAAPPPYTPSPLGSLSIPAQASTSQVLSPCRAPNTEVATPITDQFLTNHMLMEICGAVILIMHLVSPANWRIELNQLVELTDELMDGLVEAMDSDLSSMPPTKTLTALSAPHRREPLSQSRAPLTLDKKKEKPDLAEKFDKKPRYFLDIFFQGGACMVNHQDKGNPYNMFKAEKAVQHREEGETGKTAPELHDEYYKEYSALMKDEKDALLERHAEVKAELAKVRCNTPCARIRDVLNTVHNIQRMLNDLSYRVGVKAFFCIMQSSADFFMAPQWYFTSKELERYMPITVGRKWDTGAAKVDFLKAKIRDAVLSGLVAIAGQLDIHMDYLHHEESIVLKHSVELVGWSCDRFVNPSKLSSALPVLQELRDALKDGKCKWVKLTPEQLQSRRATWKADFGTGKATPRTRNPRSNIGKKRKRAAHSNNNNGEDDKGGDDGDDTTAPAPNNTSPTAAMTKNLAPVIEEPLDASLPPPSKRLPSPEMSPGLRAPRKPRAKAASNSTQAMTDLDKENTPATKRKGKAPRNDPVTRRVAADMKKAAARCCVPKSRTIISNDEDNDEEVTPTQEVVSVDAAGVPIDPALIGAAV